MNIMTQKIGNVCIGMDQKWDLDFQNGSQTKANSIEQ